MSASTLPAAGIASVATGLGFALLGRAVTRRAYVGSDLAARPGFGDILVFVTLVLFGIGAAGASPAAYRPPAALRRGFGAEGA